MMAAKKNKVGRPRTITDEVLDDLFAWVAEGKTIRQFSIQKKHSLRGIYNYFDRPEIAAKLARARELGEQAIIDEMSDIADGRDLDDPDDIAHRKLRLWMREKRLVWMNPSKYAQRKQVEKTTTHKIQLSDTERELRIKQLLEKARKGPEIKVSIEKDAKELNSDE